MFDYCDDLIDIKWSMCSHILFTIIGYYLYLLSFDG